MITTNSCSTLVMRVTNAVQGVVQFRPVQGPGYHTAQQFHQPHADDENQDRAQQSDAESQTFGRKPGPDGFKGGLECLASVVVGLAPSNYRALSPGAAPHARV